MNRVSPPRGLKLAIGSAIIVLAIYLGVGGCGVSVKYAVPKEDEAGLIRFRLVGSILTLAAKEKKAGGGGKSPGATAERIEVELQGERVVDCPEERRDGVPQRDASACFKEEVIPVVTPTEGSQKLAIVVHDWPWRRTTLSASFLDRQPELLKELGAEVTDYSVEAIGAAASIAKAAIGMGLVTLLSKAPVAPPPPPKGRTKRQLKLPAAIDVSRALVAGEQGKWTLFPDNEGWWYKLVKVSEPEDEFVVFDQDKSEGKATSRVAAKKFFGKFSENGWRTTGSFPVSSCQRVELLVVFMPGAEEDDLKALEDLKHLPLGNSVTVGNLIVADPRYVETYPIPEKGSIKMKGTCGADVDSKPSGVASGWKVIQTLADQAQAVKAAQEQAKEKEGKKGQKQ